MSNMYLNMYLQTPEEEAHEAFVRGDNQAYVRLKKILAEENDSEDKNNGTS